MRHLKISVVWIACILGLGAQTGWAESLVLEPEKSIALPPVTIDDQGWNVHGQFTFVNQWHQNFIGGALPDGQNSLQRRSASAETADFTLFFGVNLWNGAALYFNPEIDQGFGLSNTLGLGGYSSAEAYKVGANTPYYRDPRAFIRYTLNLGGQSNNLHDQPNQLKGSITENNLVVTFGKFSVVDVFDINTYAHDPKLDFLNWAGVDAGAFDYAADAWGYTYGLALEWTQDDWTWRNGFFDLSTYPNSENIDQGLKQYQLVTEFEKRHELWDQPGKLKLLVFANRGKMARYSDAVAQSPSDPDLAKVRKLNWKAGIAVNLEQQMNSSLALFGRASINDGSKETYEFTDINQSLSLGLSIKGSLWNRPQDTLGAQIIVNGLSGQAKDYYAAGGLGLLVGDGYLKYDLEKIIEMYYGLQLMNHLALSFDLQNVTHPAYNILRGPVTIYAVRLHADF